MSWKSIGCVLLASSLVFGAVGCGTQEVQGGFGSFTLTSVAPNPVPGMIPTPITITGGDFSNMIGTVVDVEFAAPAGTIPFLGGTSDEVTVEGTITSATTIDTTSPRAVICGPTSVSAAVRVTLPSGVWGSSVVPLITFEAPTVTAFAAGGGVFPAAIPTPFTLNGTGFGDIGSPVTIHWRTTPAGAGPAIFDNAAEQTIETEGIVASGTTITGTSPEATVCGVASVAAEIYRVSFQDGSCTPTGTSVAASFVAPTITSIVNAEPGGVLTGTNDFDAARPVDFSITGTGFGPTGGTAQVTFTAAAGTPFNGGTSLSVTVPGTIVNSTTVAGTSPMALVCGIASVASNVVVTVPNGSCVLPPGPVADFLAPTFTSITNTSTVGPWAGTSAPGEFAAAVPEPFQITGTGFGPVGGTAFVTWQNDAGGFPNPYENGTSDVTTVPAQITSSTTLVGVSPAGAFCSVTGINSAGHRLTVTLPDGSCTLISAFASAVMQPPTVTAISNLDGGGSVFEAAIPETFEITGTDFGPIGGTATIRFTSTAVGLTVPGTPFDGGTASFVDVLATITSRTTIQGTSPESLLCPIPGTDPATGVTADVEILATLEGGSCNTTTAPAAGTPFAALFQGPTLTGATLLSTAPFPTGTAGGPELDVPSTLLLGQDEPFEFEINGTGFAPLGAIVLVTFEDIGNGTGAADLNGASTLTVPAVVVSETLIRGDLPLITLPRLTLSEIVRTTVTLAPNGSCAFDDAMIEFIAPPTVTSVVNNDAGVGTGLLSGFTAASGDQFASTPSNTTITGTAFAGPDLIVYSTNDGLDPTTDVPLRVFGTANPPIGVLGLTDYDFDFVANAAAVTQLSTSITGGVFRVELKAPDLDTDGDGLVPYTVRIVNFDGQYHDFAAGDYVLQGTTVNLGTSGNIRNNNSIAVNPVSFTTDFQNPFPGADPTDDNTGANLIAVSNDEVPGGGFGLFNATDIFVARSLDGGTTWTTGALGAAAIDGLPAGANRSFAKVGCDALGNTYLAYVVDDFAGINFDASIVLLNSSDAGATWTNSAISPFNLLPFSAGAANFLDLATGPDVTAGQEQVMVTWVDSTTTFAAFDKIRLCSQVSSALGTYAPSLIGLAISDTVVAPPAFTIAANECAVGNSGELYAAWQEPTFAGPPLTTNFHVDVDRDGAFAFTFGFGADVLAFSDFVPFFAVPLYADISFFEPSMDLAVARAGTNAGRLLWVYDRIAPNAGGALADHAQLIARYSDDRGQNWSGGVAPHPVDGANRIIPAVCSDGVTGRFYVTWYDGTPGLGTPAPQLFDRRGSASDDGVNWGTVLNLSGARGASAHTVDFDTDFGAYAGVCAYNGAVYATWSDTVDSGTNADPVVVGYQQK